MTEGFDVRFAKAMRLAGWRYEIWTNGFRKGSEWVSHAQAQGAFDAAERNEPQVIEPVIESVAAVVAKAANDGIIPS